MSKSFPIDFTRVATIKVLDVGGRFELKVDPEVLVTRRLEIGQGVTVEQAEARLKDLVAKIEELARRQQSVPREQAAEVGRVRGDLAKARGDLAAFAGPGVVFKTENLPSHFSLEIDFTSQRGFKGPFVPAEASPSHPVRGRYLLSDGQPTIETGKVDLEHFPDPSIWKYEVVLRDAGNRDLVAIDPMIVLK